MKILILTSVLVGLTSLSGCGTPSYIVKADQYAKQGNCPAALYVIDNSGMWLGDKYYMMAGVYETCFHNRVEAIKWATLSARYDVQQAKDFLARAGAPIPNADIYKNGKSVSCNRNLTGGVTCSEG